MASTFLSLGTGGLSIQKVGFDGIQSKMGFNGIQWGLNGIQSNVGFNGIHTRMGTVPARTQSDEVLLHHQDEIDESQFVEVGVVVSKHGIRGEILIKSSTDFPQERFEKPGMRWMKMPKRGKEQQKIKRVDLIKGRVSTGKSPCWLLTLKDVTSPEKAAEYVGATMLVKRGDKPELEEGEFYTPDLIGMEVIVQNSGESIGTIADICNFGAGDLLRVKRDPKSSVGDEPLIWIPFVEAIVPEVDMHARKVTVNPPEGLLELNSAAKRDATPNPRKEALKTKRKLQEQKSGLKKSLMKTKQEHLLAGCSIGKQEEREVLLNELMEIDFKALQASFNKARERSSQYECRLSGFTERHVKNQITQDSGQCMKQGLDLIADSRVAVASLLSPGLDVKPRLELYAQHLAAVQKRVTLEFPEGICQIPWFICTSADFVEKIESLFEDNEYFGLQQTQVCVLTQESYPCFDTNNQIIRDSPWKITKSLTGDGGVLKTLITEGLVKEFAEKEVDYVQVLNCDNTEAKIADPVFFGFAQMQKSDLSIQVVPVEAGSRSNDIIGFTRVAEDEDGIKYDLLVKRGSEEHTVPTETLVNAVNPLGNYILSVSFAKGLQEQGYEFELCTNVTQLKCYSEQDSVEYSNAFRLGYHLLDCLSNCSVEKVSLYKDECGEHNEDKHV